MFNYAELDCISNFTFLRGSSHPEELVQRAARLGYSALALSDECSVSGIVRAYQEAKKYRITLITGSRFRISGDTPEHAVQNSRTELIILACTSRGYSNLCELISLTRLRAGKGRYTFYLDDILNPPAQYVHLKHLPDCLILCKPGYTPDPAQLGAQLHPLLKSFA